jgi:hypothetical protein
MTPLLPKVTSTRSYIPYPVRQGATREYSTSEKPKVPVLRIGSEGLRIGGKRVLF